MAEPIPSQPILPLPLGVDAVTANGRYLLVLVEALQQEFMLLRAYLNDRIMQGTAAQKPTAAGTRRLYWVTDGTPHMEYDNGSWVNV